MIAKGSTSGCGGNCKGNGHSCHGACDNHCGSSCYGSCEGDCYTHCGGCADTCAGGCQGNCEDNCSNNCKSYCNKQCISQEQDTLIANLPDFTNKKKILSIDIKTLKKAIDYQCIRRKQTPNSKEEDYDVNEEITTNLNNLLEDLKQIKVDFDFSMKVDDLILAASFNKIKQEIIKKYEKIVNPYTGIEQ